MPQKIEDATVYGFRTSFRDWGRHVSNFPREIAETAPAHVIGDKAEQAYRRGDAIFRETPEVDGSMGGVLRAEGFSNVVQLRKQSPSEQRACAKPNVGC